MDETTGEVQVMDEITGEQKAQIMDEMMKEQTAQNGKNYDISSLERIQTQKTKRSEINKFWEKRGAIASAVAPRMTLETIRFYNGMTPAVLKAALNKKEINQRQVRPPLYPVYYFHAFNIAGVILWKIYNSMCANISSHKSIREFETLPANNGGVVKRKPWVTYLHSRSNWV
uniref:Uncharacterized protein n=1 Tax=Glossina austeni TaxID=7395 RepID=A0A1A9US48_GLOAU